MFAIGGFTCWPITPETKSLESEVGQAISKDCTSQLCVDPGAMLE